MRVKLREAMDAYKERTGERITYELLASRTGLAKATIESLASRDNYNATLNTIEKICHVLGCEPRDLLELGESQESNDES